MLFVKEKLFSQRGWVKAAGRNHSPCLTSHVVPEWFVLSPNGSEHMPRALRWVHLSGVCPWPCAFFPE